MKKYFHHPEKESAGNCHYCGRSLCEECSLPGTEYLHCRDENDCLDYQDEGSEAAPLPVIPNAYSLLDTYMERLGDVRDELDEIERLFEESASRMKEQVKEEGVSDQVADEADRQRITGFRGFHLAREGLSLLNLINITIAYLESSQELEAEEKVEKVKEYVKELEPRFRETLEKMTPYESVDLQESFKTLSHR